MLEYNYELHSFELKDQGIVVSFPFTDQDYLGSPMTIGQEAFIFDLVYKEGIPESDIKRIKIKSDEDVDNAVGWLLPLACLVSVEHPHAADSHFAYYAFHAYEWLLIQDSIVSNLSRGESLKSILMGESCYDGAVLQMISSTRFTHPLDKESLLPSLARYGYFKELWGKGHFVESGGKWVCLVPAFEKDPYVCELLTKHIFCEDPPLRFLRLYQVIELLIERSLIEYLKSLVLKGEKGELSTRSLDSFLRDNSELTRIRKVFEVKGILEGNYSSLAEHCKVFLQSKDIEVKEELPTDLYHVRNMIVHRLRKTSDDSGIIEKINDEFQLLVMDLLIHPEES